MSVLHIVDYPDAVASLMQAASQNADLLYRGGAPVMRKFLQHVANTGNPKTFEGELIVGLVFKNAAIQFGVMNTDGSVTPEQQAELKNWLENNPAQNANKTSTTSYVGMNGQRVEVTLPARSSHDDITRKIAALKSGDVNAINTMVDQGVRFDAMDLNTAVNHREANKRPELTQAVLRGGASCPSWLRSCIKDETILRLIDASPSAQER